MRTLSFGSIIIEAHRRHTETIRKRLINLMKQYNCQCQEDVGMNIPEKDWNDFIKWCRCES